MEIDPLASTGREGDAIGPRDPGSSDTAERHMQQFMRRMPVGGREAGGSEVRRGRAFGRYLVLDEIGSGAMGRVLKAYDDTLDRAVAIKLLHSEAAQQHAVRLKREAQALAKLSHPNVVQVYEVGQAYGEWFIAMELVSGWTLRQWQEQPRSWREQVEVYLQVGEGLAAAHAVGLVHRDFKPDNCIVDEQGRARVLDFGLVTGRAADPLDVTGEELQVVGLAVQDMVQTTPGMVMGTPAYMPLEQMDGREVDARSDQFSFCVALYEALYGVRPFEAETFEELKHALFLEMIGEGPPGARVPKRLREIVVRGLAADPSHRWEAMEELLGRLRGLVAPKGRRWLALGLAVGLGTVGVGVARYAEVGFRCEGAEEQLVGVWDDQRKAEVKEAILGTGVAYAPDVWERVVGPRLAEYADEWIDQHTEACEAARVRQEQSTEVMDLRMGCLHRAKVKLEAVVDVLRMADAGIVERAYEVVGGLRQLEACADVEALLGNFDPPRSDDVERVNGAERLLMVATVDREAGRYEEALGKLREANGVLDEIEYEPLMAELALEKGWILRQLGNLEESEVSLRDALAVASRAQRWRTIQQTASALLFVVGCDGKRAEQGLRYRELAEELAKGDALLEIQTATAVGCVLHAQGRFEEAIAQSKHALAQAKRQGMGATSGAISLLNNLGSILLSAGRLEESEAAHREALEITRRELGPEHPYAARSLSNLAIVSYARGNYARAERELRRGLDLRLRSFGARHLDVGQSRDVLGMILYAQGKYEEAEEEHRQAIDVLVGELGPEHPDVAGAHNNLANVLYAQERLMESEIEHRTAMEIRTRVLEPGHPDIAASMSNIAVIAHELGRPAEAEEMHRKALAIFENAVGPDHPHAAIMRSGLAGALRMQGKLEEAEQEHRNVLELRMKVLGVSHPDVAQTRSRLARVLWDRGRMKEAEQEYGIALDIWEESLGEQHPEVGEAKGRLAELLIEQGRYREARRLAEEARVIGEASASDPHQLADAEFTLARSLWPKSSMRARARSLAKKALSSYQGGPEDQEQAEVIRRWLASHRLHGPDRTDDR